MPLLGRDRAVIQFFIDTGLVKANGFETADVVGVLKMIAEQLLTNHPDIVDRLIRRWLAHTEKYAQA